MAERSFKSEVAKLRLGAGEEFRGEGILAVTKALLQSGVSYVSGYQGAPISHLVDVLADADDVLRDPQVVILELEGGALVIDELFMKSGYGYEIRCEVVGGKGTIELAPTARVAVRSDLKVHLDFPPDWRGRFAEAYRCELQSWIDAIFQWRSGKVESGLGPVDGPDGWDGYRAAAISQAVLVSISSGGRVAVESKPLPELYRRSRVSAAKAGETG